MKFIQREIKLISTLSVILLAYILSWVIELGPGHWYDIFCWREWSVYMFHNSFSSIYNTTINYPPLFMYVLNFLGDILGSEDAIRKNILILKPIIFFFEVCTVVVSVYMLRKFKLNPLWSLLILLNPAFLYNSLVWGQVDGIFTAFAFGSLLCLLLKKLTPALIFLVLAINMKLQSVVFVPLFFFISIPVIKNTDRKFIITGLTAAILLQFLIIIPFLSNLDKLWSTVPGSVDYIPLVSLNAFNLWHLVLEGDPFKTADNIYFLIFTYKQWGLLLFFLNAVIILTPVLTVSLSKLWMKGFIFNKKDFELVFISAALISTAFFFFNTQMHERYIHPAILFSGLFGLLSKRFLFYILISVGYFLNMEEVLRDFNLNNYHTLIFQKWFIALVFLLAYIVGIVSLYRNYFHRELLMEIFSNSKDFLSRIRFSIE